LIIMAAVRPLVHREDKINRHDNLQVVR